MNHSFPPQRASDLGVPGTVITFVPKEKEKDVRKMQRELRRREPIEAATEATAAQLLAALPPKPVDRGDGLDGVSRRARARVQRPDGPRTGSRRGANPGRKPHRKDGFATRRSEENTCDIQSIMRNSYSVLWSKQIQSKLLTTYIQKT